MCLRDRTSVRCDRGKMQDAYGHGLFSEDAEVCEKNCAGFDNITFARADITALDYPDETFDKVVAANVIHLLDEPLKALGELDRVCKEGGMLIIPTYMNRDSKGKTSAFASAAGKAGADFKRQFTEESYEARFSKCGICTLMKELGLYEMVPAMCRLDYTMSEAGGVSDFIRQYTLASGGPYCDCG